ncbi:hypothetical protein HHX48_14840 [Salinimonas sp. HHU 13199]|uniref:Uncharacterized protein n=1 Tax=Salinimonas profundi TaxID=2729140 RepID=A0ABR8LLD6_9ALTE|nr:hypothetical protein [Salinimonas profundi]MBD3587020.1 hypothetical protein [Salinimonas profundi]
MSFVSNLFSKLMPGYSMHRNGRRLVMPASVMAEGNARDKSNPELSSRNTINLWRLSAVAEESKFDQQRERRWLLCR